MEWPAYVYEAKLDCLEVVGWRLPPCVSTLIWVLGTGSKNVRWTLRPEKIRELQAEMFGSFDR